MAADRSFQVLDHTADAGFEAVAPSLEELFEVAAEAMFSLEYDLASVEADSTEEIEIRSHDREGLLVDWLSELVFLHDARGWVWRDFDVTNVDRDSGGWVVRATARCRQIGDWFQQRGPQLKAVTMHGLELEQTNSGFRARFYVDV